MDEDDLRGRAAELLAMVELTAVRDQLVATLSGGMVRRVVLATALVHRPRLLILDEPTAGVDPLLRLRFREWFNAMVAAGTTLIVTPTISPRRATVARCCSCAMVACWSRGARSVSIRNTAAMIWRRPSWRRCNGWLRRRSSHHDGALDRLAHHSRVSA